MRPEIKSHRITKEELESIVIPKGTNRVIVHVPLKNIDAKTKSGIYIAGDHDFKPHFHAERWGYIYKLPPSIIFDINEPGHSAWETEIEACEGDMVWFDFRSALYAETYIVDGEWYKIMNYDSLYVVRSEERGTVMLNGYILFDAYRPESDSIIKFDTLPDKRFGIAKFIGKPNKRYMLDVWNDNIEVNVDDHVLFEEGTVLIPLEYQSHATFSDRELAFQHRKRILAVISDDHESIVRMRDGVIGVKMVDKSLTKTGIKLVSKTPLNYEIGNVVESTHKDIHVGDVIIAPRGRGTEFNDIIYLTEDLIYYYENK